MSNNKELLPCPFCGCKATYVKHSAGMPGTQGFDKWDAVACKHCRATVGACDRRFRCREDAAEVWNRRVAQPVVLSDEHPFFQLFLCTLGALALHDQKNAEEYGAKARSILAAKEQA